MYLCEEELGDNFSYIDRLEIFFSQLIIKLHDARKLMSVGLFTLKVLL